MKPLSLDLDGPYSLGEKKFALLRQLTDMRDIRSILEFGSGRTTARFCRDYTGASVTSVDHDIGFLQETRRLCMQTSNNGPEPKLLHLPLRWQRLWGQLFLSYALTPPCADIGSGSFDLCLIDGPVQNKTLGGREFVLYRVFPFLGEGAIIALDDCHRKASQHCLKRWQYVFGDNLKILVDEGNMAVLQKCACEKPVRKLGAYGWFCHHLGLPKILFKQFLHR